MSTKEIVSLQIIVTHTCFLTYKRYKKNYLKSANYQNRISTINRCF